MIISGPMGGIGLGDVITLKGHSVPPDLEGKWFIVEDRTASGDWVLSCPYWDQDCERPYYPPPPLRRSFRHGAQA